MIASYALVTGPVQEPISVEDAKRQARIVGDDSNAIVLAYIRAAREAAEESLGRGLFTQTWRLALSDFAESLSLPMAAPLQSVTGVTYYDVDGTLQTLATSYYTVDTFSRPGRVTRAANQAWPALQSDRQSPRVFITYVVGWTSVEDIPERIKQGIRQYVTYLDADRDGMDIQSKAAADAAERCWMDKVWWIPPCA